uniref:Caffeic acid O-methyltransferase n=1 Tax=Reaumuria trigyna TaxID=1091135 RepID=A0A0S3TFM0_9CARY|nr:caffeic acid O-methyltransferase [Reaumuria trigyna]
MTLLSGVLPPMVLQAVTELDVLEIIKRAGPNALMSASEIASKLPNNRNKDAGVMLDRMLCLLASYSILTFTIKTLPGGDVERLYGLAPPCKFLTKNEDGASLSPFCYMNKAIFQTSSHLKDAVLEGGTTAFHKTFGMTSFEYMEREPSYNKIFNTAMSNISGIVMKKILDTYDGFEDLTSLVDVGGGTGATLNLIVSKYPNISGINMDLPHVIKDAPSYSGVQHVEGNMFDFIPSGDAIFMKRTCHGWSDEDCIKILKNCYAALPKHGKVIVCDHILPFTPNDNYASKKAFHLDVMMLSQAGGKERTAKQFEGLAKASGFKVFRVACSAYTTDVMEFLKN